MKHLIVVGAGIAGSSATRIAQTLGWHTTLIDGNPAQAASHSALATIRPTWFDKQGKTAAARSWKWYEQWGATITQTAMVSDWRKPEPTQQTNWWLVDPTKPLLQPTINQHAAKIEPYKVTLDDGQTITGDAVLTTTGAYGNPNADWQPLAGATLSSNEAQLNDGPLRIHHLRPYHSLTVGNINGQTRLGSSAHKSMDKAIDEVFRMLHAAMTQNIIDEWTDWTLHTGIRARRPKNEPITPTLGNPNTTIGALARSGYAFAPDLAHQWLLSL